MKIKTITLEIEDDNLKTNQFIIKDFICQSNDIVSINTTEEVSISNKYRAKREITQNHKINIELECIGYSIIYTKINQ